jgi:hypothetical protein
MKILLNDKIELKMMYPNIPDIEFVAIEGLDCMTKHLEIPNEKIGDAQILAMEFVINAFEYSGDTSIEPSIKKTLTIMDFFNCAGKETSAENVLQSLH